MRKYLIICILLFVTCLCAPVLAADDWLANEVLTQLSDIRRDISGLNKQVQELRADIDALKAKEANPQGKAGVTSFNIGKGKSMGVETAEYAIVEFTDYECPFCARHNKKTLGQIKEKYVDTGEIQYLIRDFPLGFHREARAAAIAASCAGEQDAYWKMHDRLFDNIGKLNNGLYEQIAGKLKLDMIQFKKCLNDPKQAKQLDSEIALGKRAGVSGTPAFFIGRLKDGQLTEIKALSGAQPFSSFSRIINSIIN